jgi:hypothetical protein
MSEWYDNQKKPNSNFRKLLQERIDKENPRRKLTAEEAKRLANLEALADKLKRGVNNSRWTKTQNPETKFSTTKRRNIYI